MAYSKHEALVRQLLDFAGIEVGGIHPYDIRVNDERFYRRVLSGAELGLGETYMGGWWEADNVDEFVFKILRADLQEKVKRSPAIALQLARFKFFNMQTREEPS